MEIETKIKYLKLVLLPKGSNLPSCVATIIRKFSKGVFYIISVANSRNEICIILIDSWFYKNAFISSV